MKIKELTALRSDGILQRIWWRYLCGLLPLFLLLLINVCQLDYDILHTNGVGWSNGISLFFYGIPPVNPRDKLPNIDCNWLLVWVVYIVATVSTVYRPGNIGQEIQSVTAVGNRRKWWRKKVISSILASVIWITLICCLPLILRLFSNGEQSDLWMIKGYEYTYQKFLLVYLFLTFILTGLLILFVEIFWGTLLAISFGILPIIFTLFSNSPWNPYTYTMLIRYLYHKNFIQGVPVALLCIVIIVAVGDIMISRKEFYC